MKYFSRRRGAASVSRYPGRGRRRYREIVRGDAKTRRNCRMNYPGPYRGRVTQLGRATSLYRRRWKEMANCRCTLPVYGCTRTSGGAGAEEKKYNRRKLDLVKATFSSAIVSILGRKREREKERRTESITCSPTDASLPFAIPTRWDARRKYSEILFFPSSNVYHVLSHGRGNAATRRDASGRRGAAVISLYVPLILWFG